MGTLLVPVEEVHPAVVASHGQVFGESGANGHLHLYRLPRGQGPLEGRRQDTGVADGGDPGQGLPAGVAQSIGLAGRAEGPALAPRRAEPSLRRNLQHARRDVHGQAHRASSAAVAVDPIGETDGIGVRFVGRGKAVGVGVDEYVQSHALSWPQAPAAPASQSVRPKDRGPVLALRGSPLDGAAPRVVQDVLLAGGIEGAALQPYGYQALAGRDGKTARRLHRHTGRPAGNELVAGSVPKPESTEGRPWGQSLKKPEGAPLNLR